jgi:hypothetical protein
MTPWEERGSMAQSSLEQTLELIEELNEAELQQVQAAIQERLAADDEAARMERVHQALLTSGLVKKIKRPIPRSGEEPPAVPIKGKPISETIIEERR